MYLHVMLIFYNKVVWFMLCTNYIWFLLNVFLTSIESLFFLGKLKCCGNLRVEFFMIQFQTLRESVTFHQNHTKPTAFDNHTSNWKMWRIQLMVSGKIFNWTFTSNLNQTFSPNCPSSIEEPITFQLTIHNNHKIKELIKTYPNQIIKVFKFFT